MLFGKWHCELVGLHHTWVSHGSTNNYKRDIVGISKWDEQTRLTLGTNKGLLESSQPTTGDFFRFSRPRAGWGLRASCSMKIPLRLCESGWSVYTVYILYIYIYRWHAGQSRVEAPHFFMAPVSRWMLQRFEHSCLMFLRVVWGKGFEPQPKWTQSIQWCAASWQTCQICFNRWQSWGVYIYIDRERERHLFSLSLVAHSRSVWRESLSRSVPCRVQTNCCPLAGLNLTKSKHR